MPDANPARDEYEQATGHQTTCTAGFNDQCGCGKDNTEENHQ